MGREAALARRPLGGAEAVAGHVIEHVVPDAPVGDGPAAATAGARLVVLVVVEIPLETGLVL
jgi:hypothetical protein